MKYRGSIIRIAVFAALFLLGITSVFSQDDGYIPEELLRPRREEAPRYPVDLVIGPLGQGEASKEAYEFARRIAATLLAGNMNASILSTVNKTFLESCMNMLETVNPRFFRLGSGREEPDGSVSFLVRFVGRERGITGELFIRWEERKSHPPPPQPAPESEKKLESESDSADQKEEQKEAAIQEAAQETAFQETEQESATQKAALQAAQVPVPPRQVPVEKIWVFEDLILEEPRSRETENEESRHRFDFPPYERFF